jgi:hypothetical protein
LEYRNRHRLSRTSQKCILIASSTNIAQPPQLCITLYAQADRAG